MIIGFSDIFLTHWALGISLTLLVKTLLLPTSLTVVVVAVVAAVQSSPHQPVLVGHLLKPLVHISSPFLPPYFYDVGSETSPSFSSVEVSAPMMQRCYHTLFSS